MSRLRYKQHFKTSVLFQGNLALEAGAQELLEPTTSESSCALSARALPGVPQTAPPLSMVAAAARLLISLLKGLISEVMCSILESVLIGSYHFVRPLMT